MKPGNNASGATGKESVRDSVLDYMRNSGQANDEGRLNRARRHAETRPGKSAPSFADLPEYKQVLAQRSASAQLGMANPFYRAHETAAGATTRIDGRALINFASYDYLGLNQHPTVIARAKAALDNYAVSASASRVVGGERLIHTALEDKIAALYGVDAAVTFVSGYLTNVAAISCLMGPNDLVIHDEFIHNSALSGIKLSGAARRFFRHNDLRDLERVLNAASGQYRRVLVVVEGIYSMDGDIADLPGLVRLRAEYGFWLMVDEAHSLGVMGEGGKGLLEHFHCDPADVDIRMGTLSKTTSSCGGYIAGSEALVAVLKASAGGFVYSVGLAPSLAAAALASLEVMEAEPERVARLKRNGRHFLETAQKAGLDTGLSLGFSVVPVIVGDSVRAVQLSNDLLEAGVNALPIIHPAVPEGLARLRFFITSEHTPEQIETTVALTAEKLGSLKERNFGIGSVDIQALAEFL